MVYSSEFEASGHTYLFTTLLLVTVQLVVVCLESFHVPVHPAGIGGQQGHLALQRVPLLARLTHAGLQLHHLVGTATGGMQVNRQILYQLPQICIIYDIINNQGRVFAQYVAYNK